MNNASVLPEPPKNYLSAYEVLHIYGEQQRRIERLTERLRIDEQRIFNLEKEVFHLRPEAYGEKEELRKFWEESEDMK